MLQAKTEVWTGYYNSRDCQRNRHAMFIFGDNLYHKGHAGQATIRDESNAFGIPTQVYPGFKPWCHMNDNNYERNIQGINHAIDKIIRKSNAYQTIYFPEFGVGTGLAQLKTKAPKTWNYLCTVVKKVFGINNEQTLQSNDQQDVAPNAILNGNGSV